MKMSSYVWIVYAADWNIGNVEIFSTKEKADYRVKEINSDDFMYKAVSEKVKIDEWVLKN